MTLSEELTQFKNKLYQIIQDSNLDLNEKVALAQIISESCNSPRGLFTAIDELERFRDGKR